ncbi:MAG: HD domain-containing protein [Candidatus Nanoarchaeia archaeon]
MELADITNQLRLTQSELSLFKKAYSFTKEVTSLRKNGTYFSFHALGTASLATSLSFDKESILACILLPAFDLHSEKFILKEFGEELFSLLEGTKKITRLTTLIDKPESKAEELRKVILATARDIRPLLIILCASLQTMRTLSHYPKQEQLDFSQKSLDIYAPLAYRLGLAPLKAELEDLAFSYLYPKEYNTIVNELVENKEEREERIKQAILSLSTLLKKRGIKAEFSGRAKHLYSIYKKIQTKNYTLADIKDLTAIRIITFNVEDCYKALDLINNLWKQPPGTFKDYISSPKENGYQSLHLVVSGPENKPLEIQIRTKEMHDAAEEGVAVHYGYKGVTHTRTIDKKLGWLKNFFEQREHSTSKEFKNLLKLNLFEDRIFVFTPRGKVLELPPQATVLDFAYLVHSTIGEHAIGAHINGKYSPLKTELNTGDIVEVITSKTQHPSLDWLKIVTISKVKTRIRHYLKEHGKTLITAGKTNSFQVIKQEAEARLISVEGIKNPQLKLASCCKPLPGQPIEGYRTGPKRITIHRENCTSLKKTKTAPKKPLQVRWTDKIGADVELEIEAIDRVGLLAEIINTISRQGINILNAKAKTAAQDKAQCILVLPIEDTQTLTNLIIRIKKIKNVNAVYIKELKK